MNITILFVYSHHRLAITCPGVSALIGWDREIHTEPSMFNVTVHGAGTHRGKMFSCLTSTIAGGRCFNSNAKLTQRHLVNEAEVALHHLGPDQVKRRVNRHPVETVGPHRIAKESWVVGRRRLNHEVHEEQSEKRSWRWMQSLVISVVVYTKAASPQTRPQLRHLCPPRTGHLFGLQSSPSGPESGWTSLSEQKDSSGVIKEEQQEQLQKGGYQCGDRMFVSLCGSSDYILYSVIRLTQRWFMASFTMTTPQTHLCVFPPLSHPQ